MICWALLKPNGCIAAAGVSRHPPAGYVALPPQVEPIYAEYLMYLGGEWQPRPDLPLLVTGLAGCTIQDCPEGVAAVVYDAETHVHLGRVEAEEGVLAVDLPDPGTYRIEIEAPEPWVPPPPAIVTIHPPEV